MGHFKSLPATSGRLSPFASIGGPRAPYTRSISRSRHGSDLHDGWQWRRLDGPALDRADPGNASTSGGAVKATTINEFEERSKFFLHKPHKKNLWPPFEKNIGRHTVSDISVTLKVVEVTATRQRERRLKSNQFD